MAMPSIFCIYGFLEDDLRVLRTCGYGKGLGGPDYDAVKTNIHKLRGEIQEEIKRES